jgi:hypothetical protein
MAVAPIVYRPTGSGFTLQSPRMRGHSVVVTFCTHGPGHGHLLCMDVPRSAVPRQTSVHPQSALIAVAAPVAAKSTEFA